LRTAGTVGVLAAAVLIAPGTLVASAAAEPCPDVDVIFARGTFEPPGVGVTGQASRCPKTKIVVGGYSQGAAVTAYITSGTVPANFSLPEGITGPLAPDVTRHVAAIALFGKPSTGFLSFLVHDAPPIDIGHPYASKTI
jgi:cutinase